ncbi:MAG: ABC transporter ATP-binding protein [Propionibacteriaceae bacterium]|nr:ABC transporter ATP-binding protein [Propionibacteriaceae bacterium]
MVAVDVIEISKRFRSAGRTVDALDGFSMRADSGELVALVGPSGTGKTTLLRILGCQLAPDRGRVLVDGRALPRPGSSAGARFRSREVGFVFQELGLVEEETAVANVALPLRYAGVAARPALRRAEALLAEVGLADLAGTPVATLSTGQRQRVAIARAQANDPGLILADEATSNLDQDNTADVLGLLRGLAGRGATVVLATHDEQAWRACDRVVTLPPHKNSHP